MNSVGDRGADRSVVDRLSHYRPASTAGRGGVGQEPRQLDPHFGLHAAAGRDAVEDELVDLEGDRTPHQPPTSVSMSGFSSFAYSVRAARAR